jgi:hypothetical protein
MCMICVLCVFHFSVFVEIFIVKAFTSFYIHINNFFFKNVTTFIVVV